MIVGAASDRTVPRPPPSTLTTTPPPSRPARSALGLCSNAQPLTTSAGIVNAITVRNAELSTVDLRFDCERAIGDSTTLNRRAQLARISLMQFLNRDVA